MQVMNISKDYFCFFFLKTSWISTKLTNVFGMCCVALLHVGKREGQYALFYDTFVLILRDGALCATQYVAQVATNLSGILNPVISPKGCCLSNKEM